VENSAQESVSLGQLHAGSLQSEPYCYAVALCGAAPVRDYFHDALGQEVAIGLEAIGARHVEAPALEALQACWSIGPSIFTRTSRRTVTSRSGVTPMR
jgi:hypothetical protein